MNALPWLRSRKTSCLRTSRLILSQQTPPANPPLPTSDPHEIWCFIFGLPPGLAALPTTHTPTSLSSTEEALQCKAGGDAPSQPSQAH